MSKPPNDRVKTHSFCCTDRVYNAIVEAAYHAGAKSVSSFVTDTMIDRLWKTNRRRKDI